MRRDLYLLHFEPPYKHAGHYLGVARNGVARRWIEHNEKRGAKLTIAAKKAGSMLVLVRIWPKSEFGLEMKLKGRSLKPLCPVCKRRHK